MLLGIISDTHDKPEAAEMALHHFSLRQVDMVVHCGDWKSPAFALSFAGVAARLALPVRGVLGNNDTDVRGFLNLALAAPGDFALQEGTYERSLGTGRLVAYHGHHKPTLRRILADPHNRIVLLGHSHKPLVDTSASRLVVNPGSTAFAIPRSKIWRPSVALVDTEARTATIEYLDR